MDTVNISMSVIVLLVAMALAFDFMNGFHDAANAIATVVSTRVMKPHTAVAMAAICNVAAIFVFELKVAATVGKGTIEPFAIDYYVIFGALAGAIAHARLARLYYGASDPKGGGVEHGARVFTHPTCHHKPEVFEGIAAEEAGVMLREFFAGRR